MDGGWIWIRGSCPDHTTARLGSLPTNHSCLFLRSAEQWWKLSSGHVQVFLSSFGFECQPISVQASSIDIRWVRDLPALVWENFQKLPTEIGTGRERERAVGFIFSKPKLLPRPPLPALSQPDAKSMSFVICWPAICHLPLWRLFGGWSSCGSAHLGEELSSART